MPLHHHAVRQPLLLHDRRWGVRRLGVREAMAPQMIHRPSGNQDYLLMLFHGEAWIADAGPPRPWPPGTFMIWPPGAPHHYGHPERPWEHTWIHLCGSAIREGLAETGLPLGRPFPAGSEWPFPRFVQDVFAEVTGPFDPDREILRLRWAIWCRESARSRQPTGRSAEPERLRAVREFLEQDLAGPIRLAALAARAGYSVPHFISLFRQHYGTTPMAFARGLRLERAAFLLRDVNLPVKAVAAQCGCEDLFSFSRAFKTRFGRGPREFRRALTGGAPPPAPQGRNG